jgi:hypothetical protein
MAFIDRSLIKGMRVALEFYPHPGFYEQVSGLPNASQRTETKVLTGTSSGPQNQQ